MINRDTNKVNVMVPLHWPKGKIFICPSTYEAVEKLVRNVPFEVERARISWVVKYAICHNAKLCKVTRSESWITFYFEFGFDDYSRKEQEAFVRELPLNSGHDMFIFVAS